jgi:TPR repeat protein
MELAKHIELAPRNGDFMVLLDGCSDAWEVGRWSPESSRWVQIDGKPLRIFPTHWVALSGDAAGSDNSEGLSFLVPPPAPIQIAPKRRRASVIVAVAATTVFIGGCAAIGFGLIGGQANSNAGETIGSATELRQEASRAREAADVIARELAAARETIAAHIKREDAAQVDARESKQTADARQNELKQAVGEREARAEALAQELASVRKQFVAARDEIALHIRRENTALAEAREARRLADDRQKELKSAIDERKAMVDALAHESSAPVASGGAAQAQPRNPPVSESNASGSRSDATAVPRPTPAEPGQVLQVTANSSTEEARLVGRADMLIKQSDFTGARLLLERALEKGSARAAFMMAETYDWRTLRALRAYGVRGDPEKARELYELAAVAGIEHAQERLEALKSGSPP